MLVVNGEELDYTKGMNVRDVLKLKGYSFPLLIVSINGKRIARNKFEETLVEDSSDIKVIHLMSGG